MVTWAPDIHFKIRNLSLQFLSYPFHNLLFKKKITAPGSLDHILDYGIFVRSTNTSLQKSDYQTLLDRMDSELTMCKLTKEHLRCSGQNRQNVRMAAQFFTTRQI